MPTATGVEFEIIWRDVGPPAAPVPIETRFYPLELWETADGGLQDVLGRGEELLLLGVERRIFLVVEVDRLSRELNAVWHD